MANPYRARTKYNEPNNPNNLRGGIGEYKKLSDGGEVGESREYQSVLRLSKIPVVDVYNNYLNSNPHNPNKPNKLNKPNKANSPGSAGRAKGKDRSLRYLKPTRASLTRRVKQPLNAAELVQIDQVYLLLSHAHINTYKHTLLPLSFFLIQGH